MPLTFDANHPFLFVLRDLSTGTLLFVGQVTDPSAS
jgi:serine protease inhibitor